MEKIKREDIQKETTKLRETIDKTNAKIANQKLQEELKKLGYSLVCLGTGKKSFSCSMQIDTWKLNNSFIYGEYFGIGIANQTYGRGKRYFAWVKEIID